MGLIPNSFLDLKYVYKKFLLKLILKCEIYYGVVAVDYVIALIQILLCHFIIIFMGLLIIYQ